MFILYALVAGLLLGLLMGGRLDGIARIRFRWAPLIIVALLVQVVLFTDAVAARVGDLGPIVYVASTMLAGIAIIRNLRLPGLPLIALGAVSNLVTILANGGYMPADPSAVAALGRAPATIYSNSSVVAAPAFPLLIDRFAMPTWIPFANVFSVGDVILGVGVAVLLVVAMRPSPGIDDATVQAPAG